MPSSTWRSFLRNHAEGIAAIDMFVVASASFRLLYVMIILAHDRRKIVRTAVTEHPTAAWLSRQVVYSDDQHQRCRTYLGDVAVGRVLHQHLERAQRDLVAP